MVEHTMHTLWRHAHQVLYPTEGSPIAAAIMSCGLISKYFESSLYGWKIVGLVYRYAASYDEGTPVISSTSGLGTFFRRLAFIVKSKLLLFCLHSLFCFALFIVHPGLYWLRIKVSITVTPHEHHGVSEQRQLLIKGQNSAFTNPSWGLQSSVASPHKGPLMRKTFPCYAGESVWNQGRISNTMYRNPCWNP